MPFCVDLERKLWSMSLLWIGKNPNLGEKIYDKTWKFTFCQSVTWRTLEDSKVVWCGWICWIITTLSTLDNMGKKQGHGRVTQWRVLWLFGGLMLGQCGIGTTCRKCPRLTSNFGLFVRNDSMVCSSGLDRFTSSWSNRFKLAGWLAKVQLVVFEVQKVCGSPLLLGKSCFFVEAF